MRCLRLHDQRMGARPPPEAPVLYKAKKRCKDKGLSEFTDEAMESSGEGNLTMNLKSHMSKISTKLS